jgi:predicted kinase
MMNICTNCGVYRADKEVEPNGPYAICPECGQRLPFRRLPLLIVCGASGSGKSTVCRHLLAHRHLLGQLDGAVLLDADILWRAEFNQPETKYRDFYETWLRVCKGISQSGRPVVLFNAGGIPENVEPCVERRYFSRVHYLALTCEESALAERLRSRPKWQKCGDPAYVAEHCQFNQWFKENGKHTEPAIELLDTSGVPVRETTAQVVRWIYAKLGDDGGLSRTRREKKCHRIYSQSTQSRYRMHHRFLV